MLTIFSLLPRLRKKLGALILPSGLAVVPGIFSQYEILHKSVPPSQICTFLGIELDSVLMEARLDAPKLCLTLTLLEKILRKKAIQRRDLESVAGKVRAN